MPAKAPIYLKTGGRSGPGGKGPRKLREILSADMISPPLGDFRHTAHVGRGGSDDMFGDTSFLKDETESTWNSTSKLSEKPVNGGSMNFYHLSGSHTLDSRNKKKTSQAEVDDGGSTTLKSASSLPHLSTDEETASEKERQAFDDHCFNSRSEEDVSLAQSQMSGTPVRTSNGLGGPPKPRRILSIKTGSPDDVTEHEIHSGILPDQSSKSDFDSKTLDCSEDETWKFDLDLGPPLMEEIMGIIGKSKSSF